jgi:hypothetical protein
MKVETLGVDIGGVLIAKARSEADTSFFSDQFLETPVIAGAFETIRRLSRERFCQSVHLVSKCGPRTQAKTKLWLAHHRFEEITGVPGGHAHFCRERADKAPICERLGITHFIDDRLEVLGYLTSVARRYLFMPEDGEMRRHAQHLHRVIVVHSWAEIAADLLGALESGRL